MNKKQVFDAVVKHLFAQGKQATGRDGMCKYRGPKGTKCAVGVLIPDDEYGRWMEGQNVAHLLSKWEGRKGFTPTDAYKLIQKHEGLLRELQAVHDSVLAWRSEYDLKHRLQNVAQKFGIKTKVLDKLHFPQNAKAVA